LAVPYEAVKSEGNLKYVLVPDNNPNNKDKKISTQKQYVKTGLFDDTSIEITEGLSDDTVFLIEEDAQFGASDKKKTNPFMPQRRDNRR